MKHPVWAAIVDIAFGIPAKRWQIEKKFELRRIGKPFLDLRVCTAFCTIAVSRIGMIFWGRPASRALKSVSPKSAAIAV